MNMVSQFEIMDSVSAAITIWKGSSGRAPWHRGQERMR